MNTHIFIQLMHVSFLDMKKLRKNQNHQRNIQLSK